MPGKAANGKGTERKSGLRNTTRTAHGVLPVGSARRVELTDRDIEILTWITRHGIVTVEQIARRFFPGTSGIHAAQRRIRKLAAVHPPVIRRDRTFWRYPTVIRVTASGANLTGCDLRPARLILAEVAHSLAIVDLTEQLLPDTGHPDGGIRLGALRDNRRKPFDLTPSELRSHVFIPGASGSGKTTTLARIADGALRAGEAFVIVDCKGGGLGATARALASLHRLPFVVVDPDDPKTLGYNPCTGDGADVANKLLGAFSYGEEGEIYKQVAMRVLPVIVRGLKAAKRPVTLAAIADVCDASGLSQLGYDAGGDLQDELSRLAAADGVGKSGLSSLEYRFGALLQGKFGPLFAKTPALDWDTVLSRPSVVYVSLSATAASEDVELMGRVIAQDLKQLCARRLRAEATGKAVVPVVCAFDEFAALREAEQITDLLLQARQAKMAVLLSTQYLPEAVPIRKAALSAGLLIVHRLEAKDAEEIAAQFGTRPTWKVTHQIDWDSGTTAKGSIRDVEEYVVHPNTLRRLPVGTAAVRSVATDRHAIVEVAVQ